jgi:hypothetical protein
MMLARFDDTVAGAPELVGREAAKFARLAGAGFRFPPRSVVTTAAIPPATKD